MKIERFEKKYLISVQQQEVLKLCLGSACSLDREGKYRVRSLYFDTLSGDDRKNKTMGISDRKKVRIRIYSPESDNAKLEVKRRHNDRIMKESIPVSRSIAEQMCRGIFDPSWLPAHDLELEFWELSNCIRKPCVIIDYYREAYCFEGGDVRITFDSNVCAEHAAMLYEKQKAFPIFDPDTVVLEVKYNDRLPVLIRNIMNSISLSPVSVSKYCIGCGLFL